MASLCAAFSSLSVQPRQLQTQKSAMGGQRLVAGEPGLGGWPCVGQRRAGQVTGYPYRTTGSCMTNARE